MIDATGDSDSDEEAWLDESPPTPNNKENKKEVATDDKPPTELDGACWDEVRDTLRRFGALPPQVLVVLSLEFLNSFRGSGLSVVLYNYATNEFGMSDIDAGSMLAAKGALDCVFGMAGALLVDIVGVRRTAVYALSSAVVGRALLSFGRSSAALWSAALVFSPLGESLLGVGLYRVALKKLTTPKTRTLAFAVQYAVANFAGGIADLVVDTMRRTLSDTTLGGTVFTPTRKFVILTLGVVILALLMAVFCLEDVTVADIDDQEDGCFIPDDAVEAKAMFHCFQDEKLRYRLFNTHSSTKEVPEECDDAAQFTEDCLSDNGFVSEGLMDRTSERWSRKMLNHWFAFVKRAYRHFMELIYLPDMQRIIMFSLVTFPVCVHWEVATITMTPFLERLYGEDAPVYAVSSINFFGCMVLPPIIGVLTASKETFRVIFPGILVMALSPIALIVWPTIGGSCLWELWFTLGEVFWGPRAVSWTASLAPVGKEGLFFALTSIRYTLYPIVDAFLGYLNDIYIPNCTDCRDQYGHFCKQAAPFAANDDASGGLYQCASNEEPCESMPLVADAELCPSTCLECPGWEHKAQGLWWMVLAWSLMAPLFVWLLLPYFRGSRNICSREAQNKDAPISNPSYISVGPESSAGGRRHAFSPNIACSTLEMT